MRLKTIHAAMILLAATFLVACNAVDSRVNTNNSNVNSSPSPDAAYSDGVRRITPAELEALINEGKAFVVDVRSQDSFDMGHIPGSKLIPSTEILKHVNELPRDKTIVTYCS